MHRGRRVHLYEDGILGASTMRLKQNNQAFTLTELMIVVFIVGVMAAFTIPNYTKSVERSHRKDAETQLTTIWSANQIYRAQNGQDWPPDNNGGVGYDITAINNALGLGIIANGMTYNCTGTTLIINIFTCTAVRQPASSFTITVTQAQIDSSNPSCSGSCP